MKTVASLEEDYKKYEIGDNSIEDYTDFYNYLGRVVDDIQKNWEDVFKQITENNRWRKISTIRNLLPIIFVKEDVNFYDFDNEILTEASDLLVHNLEYYERIKHASDENNFPELCKLTNFLLDHYEENVSYLNYRRDKLMSLFKGEEPVELDYQYSFNAIDEFAEKQISNFESKKQLIKK